MQHVHYLPHVLSPAAISRLATKGRTDPAREEMPTKCLYGQGPTEKSILSGVNLTLPVREPSQGRPRRNMIVV